MKLLVEQNQIEDAWRDAGHFVPYPDILSYIFKNKKTTNRDADAVFNELFQKSIQYDRKTGLRKGYLTENLDLIKKYQSLCEHEPTLQRHIFLRVWGDFSNMGGLTNALSLLTVENNVGNGRSLEGIQRAGNYIAVVAADMYSELSNVNNNGIYLYREGGDEIGGIVVLNQHADIKPVYSAVDKTVSFSAKLSIDAGIAHIEHRKRKLASSASGSRLLAGVFELARESDFEAGIAKLEASFEFQRSHWPVIRPERTSVSSLTSEQVGAHSEVIKTAAQSLPRPYAPSSIFNLISFACTAHSPSEILKAASDFITARGIRGEQEDLFYSLIDTAYKDPNTGYWRAELMYANMIRASQSGRRSYLLLAQQLNFLGINQTRGHIYCDRLFRNVATGALDVVRSLPNSGQVNISHFEPSDNILPTANKLAFLVQDADANFMKKMVVALYGFSEVNNRQNDLRDLKHPLKGYYGAPLAFAVRPLPTIINEAEAEGTLAALFKEINESENSGILFNSTELDRSIGLQDKRILLTAHRNPTI